MKKTYKKAFCILLVFSVLLSISSISAIAETTQHATGLIWDDYDSLDKVVDNAPVDSASLPSSVDLTSEFPTPDDQGNQGSCVAWAVGYALKSSQEITKRGWSKSSDAHLFSPAYIYNQINSGIDAGSTISDAMDLVVEQGVCSLNYFSYNASNYTAQPTSIQRAAASLYKAQSWNKIKGINNIKQRLSQGDGVVIGVQVYNDFDAISSSNQVYDTISGSSRGGHAICLIGYNDSKGAFKFINSWGTSWGINGYGWISYELVNNETVNHHGAACGYVLNKRTSDSYCMGDVTDDGKVTAADSRLVLRFSASLETPTPMQYALADVNGDASITATDAQAILQYASALINHLPLYD